MVRRDASFGSNRRVYGLLTGGLGLGGGVLYGALICWAVGTDVIYACQDREADVRAGVRSAAVLLGRRSRCWGAARTRGVWCRSPGSGA